MIKGSSCVVAISMKPRKRIDDSLTCSPRMQEQFEFCTLCARWVLRWLDEILSIPTRIDLYQGMTVEVRAGDGEGVDVGVIVADGEGVGLGEALVSFAIASSSSRFS